MVAVFFVLSKQYNVIPSEQSVGILHIISRRDCHNLFRAT